MSHRRTSLRLLQRMTSPIAISALLLIAPMICCYCTPAISGHQDVHRRRLHHTSSSSRRGNQPSTSAGMLPWAFQTPISIASSFGPKCDTTTMSTPRSTSIIPKSPVPGAPGGTRNIVDTPASGRDAGSPCVIGNSEGDALTSSRRRFFSGFGAAATAVVAASTMQSRASFAAARSIEDIKKAVEADFVTGYVGCVKSVSSLRNNAIIAFPEQVAHQLVAQQTAPHCRRQCSIALTHCSYSMYCTTTVVLLLLLHHNRAASPRWCKTGDTNVPADGRSWFDSR